jgi:hypothetical protein
MSCILTLTFLCAASGPGQADLPAKLRQEKLWTDPASQKALTGYLKQARAEPTDKVIAALLEHLDHDIYSYPGSKVPKEVTPESRYPVVGTLIGIGLPSVPSLVKNLAATDPNDKKGKGNHRQTLAVTCLREIYSRGGYGKELAVTRIQTELEHATGKEKEYLESALSHPLLRDK